ncbi:MAG TPA: hydroxymethylbilane synthase [Thermoplasmata archaeon]|nr:hydroxymethylbilane synthase [Thermoplasmata archaeon]
MPGRRMMTLATRGSELALAQTQEVWGALAARFPELGLRKAVVKTSGDVLADAALRDFGGKGAFVTEIDERVRAGEADVAVHSLKDIPTKMDQGFIVAAILPRPAFEDALVSNHTLAALSHGARIGTSSVRRRAMLLRARPDLQVAEIRGNVPTRVSKWRRGDYDGVVLSAAGLLRLGIDAPHEVLDPEVFVPEPGQGAVACVCRAEAPEEPYLRAIDDRTTRVEVEAEREVLHALGGGCVAPVGVHATLRGDALTIRAIVLSPDGRTAVSVHRTVAAKDSRHEADMIAEELRAMGADALLEQARRGG